LPIFISFVKLTDDSFEKLDNLLQVLDVPEGVVSVKGRSAQLLQNMVLVSVFLYVNNNYIAIE
jgi:hypothetical protein